MTEATASVPNRGAVPETLLEYEQWLCWRTEARGGRPTKIPIDPASGEFASTTDPDTWTTFQDARSYTQTEAADGLGFVFTDRDPLVGVDLDDCRDPESGHVDEWAASIIATLDS